MITIICKDGPAHISSNLSESVRRRVGRAAEKRSKEIIRNTDHWEYHGPLAGIKEDAFIEGYIAGYEAGQRNAK